MFVMPSYRSTFKKNPRNNEKSLETILNLYTIATSEQHFKFYIKQLHIDRYFLQPRGLLDKTLFNNSQFYF